jgi:hypothetical protein
MESKKEDSRGSGKILPDKMKKLEEKKRIHWILMQESPHSIFFFFFFLYYWDLSSGPTPWATPPAHFCDFFFFQESVLWTIYSSWLQTLVLTSASWVARITGMSHWHPPIFFFETGSHYVAQDGFELPASCARITKMHHQTCSKLSFELQSFNGIGIYFHH